MTDRERFELFGKYTAPRVRIGRVLSCESRDCDVIVVGYSNGRISWPVGRRHGSAACGLFLFGQLVEAVRRESNQAVAYWFGVTPKIVSKWRKALKVEATNVGTGRLRREYGKADWFAAARAKARTKARDPERLRNLSIAFKGKPRPAHVIESMRKGRTGKAQSAARWQNRCRIEPSTQGDRSRRIWQGMDGRG